MTYENADKECEDCIYMEETGCDHEKYTGEICQQKDRYTPKEDEANG